MVIEGNKGFSKEVREIKGRAIVKCKLFAEFNVLGIDDPDLVGDVFELVINFNISDIYLFIFNILIHQFLAQLSERLHLG